MAGDLKISYLENAESFICACALSMKEKSFESDFADMNGALGKITSEAEIKDTMLPVEYLSDAFSLNEFEKFCFMISVVSEISRKLHMLVSELENADEYISDDRYITSAFAVDSFIAYKGKEAKMSAAFLAESFTEGGELFGRLLDAEGAGGMPLLSRKLRLSARIRSFIFDGIYFYSGPKGESELVFPQNLKNSIASVTDIQSGKPQPDKVIYDDDRLYKVFCRTAELAAAEKRSLVFLEGADREQKIHSIRRFCSEKQIPFIITSVKGSAADAERSIGSAVFEAGLVESVMVYEFDTKTEGVDLRMLLSGSPVLVFVITEKTEILLLDAAVSDIAIHTVSFSFPAASSRRILWKKSASAAGLDAEIDYDGIADRYEFCDSDISSIISKAVDESSILQTGKVTEDDLYEQCHRKLSLRVTSRKMKKIRTLARWDDLIIPDYSRKLLEDACSQIRNMNRVYNDWEFADRLPYGRSLSMLFSGPPGTGKTMGAQAVAGRMKLELYKVNLAAVVSKYIGETEKNLEEIFEEAEKAQAVLFFDEADVLFSKRTEVKDSHDKYSNMEAAFMLQKIEEYSGICILATNYIQNFDEAFKRRIRFIVDFPFPDVHHRKLLWQRVFPEKVPLSEELDWDYLAAQFELSGSNIKNVALAAAFEASERDGAVDMDAIIRAVINECSKNGKHLSEQYLGEYYLLFSEY